MTEALRKKLILNGAIILFYGMLVGLPYALAILWESGEETVRDWSVAHDASVIGGITLLILGAILQKLRLEEKGLSRLAWSFILSFYAFAISTTLEAALTDEAFSFDNLEAIMVIVTVLSVIAGVLSFVGGWLLVCGAYNACKTGSD